MKKLYIILLVASFNVQANISKKEFCERLDRKIKEQRLWFLIGTYQKAEKYWRWIQVYEKECEKKEER